MSSKPRFVNFILIGAFAAGLSACVSVFAPPNTPTPAPPTLTPIPPTPTPPPSAARVNGEYILASEFEAEVKRYQAAQAELGREVPLEQASATVLEDLIAQTLLAQAARAEGFQLSEADLQARLAALENQAGGAAALAAWQAAQGYDPETFRAALKRSIEAAWMRDKIIAATPQSAEQIHLRQILTYNESSARAAYEQLQAGADFDELAALYDPITRGELGWIPPGYLLDEQADAAVFALQPGQYTQVIATAAGFHIFKALERGERILSPDALAKMRELALKKWLDEKRASSDIQLAP